MRTLLLAYTLTVGVCIKCVPVLLFAFLCNDDDLLAVFLIFLGDRRNKLNK